MTLKTPIVFNIYRRHETTKRVFEMIKYVKPKKLYLIADGPKNSEEKYICKKVREHVENSINWQCELIKVYSEINLGLANRLKTGLDFVFLHEEKVIILDDDTLPNSSFFKYCEELLEKYKEEAMVYHISGCNFHPSICTENNSYFFTPIVNVWGWATWRRAWTNYDVEMKSWKFQRRKEFMKKWCPNRKVRNDTLKMFDLHCENKAPGTWDYQWVYNCWNNGGLSIIPSENLVRNIGFGKDATNTVYEHIVDSFPLKTKELSFPLTHTQVKIDKILSKKYYLQNNMYQIMKRKISSFFK